VGELAPQPAAASLTSPQKSNPSPKKATPRTAA
jgi:hypothetical protein